MLDPKMLEDFGAKMSALLANTPARDIEKNAKAMLACAIRVPKSTTGLRA